MTRQRFVTDTELGEVGRITHGEGLLVAEQLIAVHGGENHCRVSVTMASTPAR